MPKGRRHGKHPSFSSLENSSEDEDATPFGPTVPLPPAPASLFATPTLQQTPHLIGDSPTVGQAGSVTPAAVPQRLLKAANVLAADPSVVFRSRTQLGYGVEVSNCCSPMLQAGH